jgi:hypothetical protein
MRCTELTLTPVTAAMAAPVQCVTAFRATTRSAIEEASLGKIVEALVIAGMLQCATKAATWRSRS